MANVDGIELGFDERAKAEATSSFINSEHYEVILKSGDMEKCLSQLVYHLEEPRVGQSYPNYFAAKLAGKFVKVVLSGIGGDEIFGGYPWRYFVASNSHGASDYLENYYLYWKRLLPNSTLNNLVSPIKRNLGDMKTTDIFNDVFKNIDLKSNDPEDRVNNSLYFEAKTFLHGLLVVEDKISMSHGLETRVPFLDNDLVEFAMSCPVGLKLKNLNNNDRIDENEPLGKKERYFMKTNNGKQLLREAMSKYVPAEITKAQKQGFSAPDATWFKNKSIQFVRNKLGNRELGMYEYLDYDTTQEILDQHVNGNANRRLFIWSMLHLSECLN